MTYEKEKRGSGLLDYTSVILCTNTMGQNIGVEETAPIINTEIPMF